MLEYSLANFFLLVDFCNVFVSLFGSCCSGFLTFLVTCKSMTGTSPDEVGIGVDVVLINKYPEIENVYVITLHWILPGVELDLIRL